MKKIILSIVVLIGFYTTYGQTDVLINSTNNGTTKTGCSYTIYDSGGNTGSYGNNQDYSVSFISNNAAQPGITLILLADLAVDATDTLWIYDGDGTSAAQLFHGGPLNLTYFNTSNPLITGDIFQTSVFNLSHKITIRFKSNGATVSTGFKISLVCSKLCQTVFSRIDTLLTTPQPDTNYIALCPWDSAHIVAYGYYPMTDTITNPFYHQSDATSTFIWDFGDGVTASGIGLSTVNHLYLSGRGYDVMLTIKDTSGCQSNNSIGLRVMTSKNPLASIAALPDICSGNSFGVGVGYSSTSTIVIAPIESQQISSQMFDSTTFIPDGTCNGLNCYNTFVTFNSFGTSQTIQSANDIMSVCINMEHSFVGDIHFQLVCPNGQSTILMNTTGSGQHGGAFLGVANETDNSSNKCDPVTNPPGTGWTYCWSQQASYTYHGTLDALSDGASPIDSTNRVNHSNYIVPDQSFSNLIGCPLNGTWNIKVCDLWAIDNGYVFWWSLDLNPNLLPQAWTYDVGIENVLWSGPYITSTSDTTAQISPTLDAGGTYDYTFTIVDTFGCQYDSLMHLNVVQTPMPNLGPDTAFCQGGIVILNPHYSNALSSYAWSDFTNDPTDAIMSPDTYIVTITNSNGNIQCKNNDTIIATYSPNPVADFSAIPTEGCSPLLVQFSDQSTPANITYTYAWDFGDPSATINTSTIKNPIHEYVQHGLYDVSLSITSPAGCHAEVTKTAFINVHPTPVAKFSSNRTSVSLSEDPNVQFYNETENFILSETSWSWNFQDGANSTDMSPTHQFTVPGDFTVTLIATNNYGCSDTVTHVIIVEDELFIPNIITPNGDNNNDFLVIGNINPNRDNVLKIYDRWGKKIYEKKNYNTTALCKKTDPSGKIWQCGAPTNADKGWNGEGAADGVYFYTFHYDGTTKVVDRSGSITVLDSK